MVAKAGDRERMREEVVARLGQGGISAKFWWLARSNQIGDLIWESLIDGMNS